MHSKATFPDRSQPEGSEKRLKKLKAPTGVSVQQRHGTGPLRAHLGGAEVLGLRVRECRPGNRSPARAHPARRAPCQSGGAPCSRVQDSAHLVPGRGADGSPGDRPLTSRTPAGLRHLYSPNSQDFFKGEKLKQILCFDKCAF